MGKGVVCHFFSNCLFATSRCIEKEAVDKMIAHFVTAPYFCFRRTNGSGIFIYSCRKASIGSSNAALRAG